MSRKRQRNAPMPRHAAPLTLAELLAALDRDGKLSATRCRDLVSAVKRVAILLGDEPAAITLDMAAISVRRRHQPGGGRDLTEAPGQYPVRLPGGRQGQRPDAG
jgi:hypothetical protein